MPALIDGSPTHVLIVHAVVVLLPLSGLAALMLVFVPTSRRAFGLASVAVAFVACVAVPLAFMSGGALRRRVPPSSLIDRHIGLAHELLPLAAAFGLGLAAFVVIDMIARARVDSLNRVEAAGAARWPHLLNRMPATDLRVATRVTAGLLVVLSALTLIQVVRVGDAGAKAAWHGRVSTKRPAVTGTRD